MKNLIRIIIKVNKTKKEREKQEKKLTIKVLKKIINNLKLKEAYS